MESETLDTIDVLIAFVFLYCILSFFNRSKYMQLVLSKDFDNETSKYVYNIKNLYSIPLRIALEFSFLVLIYVIIRIVLEGVAVIPRNDTFDNCVYIVSVTLVASIIMFAMYLYVEKFSKLSYIWISYRSESANNKNFNILLFMNFVFITVIVAIICKMDSLIPYFTLKTNSEIETKSFVLLFISTCIFSVLNLIYDFKIEKVDTRVFINQVYYTIAFLVALIYC